MTNSDKLQSVKHSKIEVDDQINIITNLFRTSTDVQTIIELKNDTNKKIDKLLELEFEIIDINYSTKVEFKGKEYNLIQLLKLRKIYDLKIKLINSITSNTSADTTDSKIAALALNEFKSVMLLRDELKELNILIASINQK
jgi:hypothetical protein